MRIIFNAIIPIGLCLLTGCREKAPTVELPPEEFGEIKYAVEEGDAMAGLPGPVYQTQVNSSIDWQPWTEESFEKARQYRRLIFAVVVMPQQPSYEESLRDLESNSDVVSEINSNYVPILIDGDAVREMGLLTIHLCAEIRSGLKLPLMIWMTPKGAPVAWMPLSGGSGQDVGDIFPQSHVVLNRMWQDENEYILSNSTMDQKMRRERLIESYVGEENDADPADVSVRSLRQLVSLYDPLSRTLDETGGLFPTGPLDLLAAGVQIEGLPGDLRKRCKDVLKDLLDDLLRSAMFDPLDGGVFSSRVGTDWSMPGFARDCSSQARVVMCLFEAYAATGDERALAKAMDLMDFVETNYRTDDGLYSFGGSSMKDTESWLWEFDEVRDLLSPDEFPVFWIAAGLKEDGNIPSENDPERKFFRLNSLRNTKDASEVAAVLGTDVGQVADLLESAKAKLLKVREARLGLVVRKRDANAGVTLRMVSVFATAYRITGDEKYRERAEELMAKSKEVFGKGRQLRLYAGEAPESLVGGRAFLYALAIQAALDVHAITLSESWKFWAADLVSTATELFAEDGYIREASVDMDLCGLPVSNNAMVFEESTIGLFAMAQKRLKLLDIPAPQALESMIGDYPANVSSNPILYTDLVQAGLVGAYGKSYLIGENSSGELREAILRLPLRAATRNISSDEPDKIRVVDTEGNTTQVEDSEDLDVPFLP
ncbi:MAG: DUF255 domain-containing protein [Akkermansiaceae bacterium]|jgi:uncharacterized protein|nr:DUF255 domain-containing protein [Akkermansiaceae bacterium]MDP4647079.1 DUF255 domain-containing protein [Akkermansiaceae bacterium]MDP4719935.1 DUF255 domain-containing protein [Akkermansiaceae bacterium]MDP4780576.1 DUF255 domain-containing protein [Akkermansiaceae bacterium]MDP4847422.1 DUF255 domain-containing protein [Akkermansiaceae bacterium]